MWDAPQVSILRTMGNVVNLARSLPAHICLARAHFLSESYDRAEAVLDELAPIIDASEVKVG
jgi:hypothetical protein